MNGADRRRLKAYETAVGDMFAEWFHENDRDRMAVLQNRLFELWQKRNKKRREEIGRVSK